MGKSRVAHVLHQQAADHLVARDNLHRTGIEGAQGAGMAHVLELRHHQRRFLGRRLLQRRAHGHQGLHRARVGVERAARGGVGGRDQDGAGMGEIDPLQVVQAQRGAAAQDDLPGVPMGAELELDVLPETGIRAFGQQGHAQAPGPPLLQETLHPSLRDQDLLQDRQRAAGPTQEDEVRVEGDRRQPLLQTVHGLAQPLHENGDERPHEQDVAEDGYRRRYRGLGDALVIAQVAWVGEAQEGPPDGVRGGREAGRERERQKTRDGRDQHDQDQDEWQSARQARAPWSVRAGTGASFLVLRTWGCLLGSGRGADDRATADGLRIPYGAALGDKPPVSPSVSPASCLDLPSHRSMMVTAVRSPVTFTEVRHMSRMRSTPRIR